MFRSRRASLVQRLWRLRCVTPGPDDTHGGLKPAAHALFKKLKDKELELLLQAVESQGESGCLWVEARGGKAGPSASLLLCRLYRWPDLRQPHEVKRLCLCKGGGGEARGLHCCNPHHLSRLALPDTPPPAYCKISPFSTPLKCANILENNCKGWEDTTLSRCSLRDGYWCKLAYWEYRHRVGRLYPVHGDYVCVFSNLPNGNGLCLGQLSSQNRSPAVRRTQAKIGRGFVAQPRSQRSLGLQPKRAPPLRLFPHSGDRGSSAPPVHKILPGYSIKVFDYDRATHLAGRCPVTGEGPHDGHTIRISFGKGWGASYTRRFITSCPCWLEVLLNARDEAVCV